MPARRTVLLFAGAFTALLAGVAVSVLLLLDSDEQRTHLEALASRALGMDVSIEGRVGLDVVSGLRLTLDDVHVHSGGSRVASVGKVAIGLQMGPLLRKELRIGTLVLNDPVLAIVRDEHGRFNVARAEGDDSQLPALEIRRLVVRNGRFSYVDQASRDKLEGHACRLAVRELTVGDAERERTISRLSFEGEADCEVLRADSLTITEFTATATVREGVMHFEPVTLQLFGAVGSGVVDADFSDGALLEAQFSLPGLRAGALFGEDYEGPRFEGEIDVSAKLATQGTSIATMTPNLEGSFSLHGEDLVLHGVDLDQTISRLEATQQVGLLDAGALFLLGPIGLVASQAYNLANLARDSGERTEIRTLVSDWEVKRGIARADDVALATDANRVALVGALDLVNRRYVEVTVGVLDKRGCALVRQRMRGSFARPEPQPPDLLQLIAGPARRLLEKGAALLGDDLACDVFYRGSVSAPGS